MRLPTIIGLTGILVASPLLAQEPLGTPVDVEPQAQPVAAEEPAQGEHTVKKGDTLWDLASHYFQDPFRWRVIYEANPRVVEDPHWIYPEEVLVIPGLVSSIQPAVPDRTVVRPLDRPSRTVFYTAPPPAVDEGPSVLMEPTLPDLPVRPGEFNSAEYLMDPDRLQVYGRLIQPLRETSEISGVVPTAHLKDEVFLAYSRAGQPRVGQRMLLVDIGEELDEAGDDMHVIIPTAIVEILRLSPEVIHARIESQFGPVERDQRMIPMEMFPDFLVEAAEPVEGGADLVGVIMKFVDEQPLHGRTDRAFINLGQRHGVRVGDVFTAFLPTRPARSAQSREVGSYRQTLPPEPVARMRVVRVTETNATVKVDDLLLPRLTDGILVRRTARIP